MKTALILAGGKGTRLQELTKNEIPKPLFEIDGKSIIERELKLLKEYNFEKIFISVGFLANKIKEKLQDGKQYGLSIEYITETTPLGSAGCLYYLKNKIKDELLVLSGDIIINIDFDKMLNFHKEHKALATLFVHPNTHPYDSDLVIKDENDIVLDFDSKNNVRNYFYNNLVNAGVYILDSKSLDYFKEEKKVNMEKDFLSSLIPSNRVFAYKSTEYVKDAGTVDRIEKVSNDLKNDIVNKKNLKYKQKCIFMDRDGTINKYKNFISNVNEIELLPNVIDAIKKINSSEFLGIVITNQPVIARGEATKFEVENMHKKIETLLGNAGAYIDDIMYCPHHPDSGFEGEIKDLKIECNCRKPKTGMIDYFVNKYNLDINSCYIIGDTNCDILTGKNAKIKTIKLPFEGKDKNIPIKADFYAKDLLDAVNIIIK